VYGTLIFKRVLSSTAESFVVKHAPLPRHRGRHRMSQAQFPQFGIGFLSISARRMPQPKMARMAGDDARIGPMWSHPDTCPTDSVFLSEQQSILRIEVAVFTYRPHCPDSNTLSGIVHELFVVGQLHRNNWTVCCRTSPFGRALMPVVLRERALVIYELACWCRRNSVGNSFGTNVQSIMN